MIRKALLSIAVLLSALSVTAQQGVSISATGATPDASAMLDVSATDKGLLIPRMTASNITAISNPAKGLLIYQTDGVEGFYYNSGTAAAPSWTYINAAGVAGAQGSAGPQGATGANGATGAAGANGATWYTGSSVPAAATGANGDYYLRGMTGDVYQKASGSWSIVANITGPAGSDATISGVAAGGDLVGTYPNPTIAGTAGADIVTAINAGSSAIDAAKVFGVVHLAPATAQTATTNNGLIRLNLNGTGTLGNAGSAPLISLSAAGTYADGTTYSNTERFRADNDGSILAEGIYNSGNVGNIPKDGSGTRMMWYAGKGAFRAGTINGTQWDDANTGLYSVAMGENCRASGDYGIAMGYNAVAANTGTIALGESTYAVGANSVALGYGASTRTTAGSPRQGTFVFSDRSLILDYSFNSSNLDNNRFHPLVNHSFNVRCSGGYYLWTNSGTTTGLRLSTLSTSSNEYGSFVWTDRSSDASLTPTAQNQTIFRSSGGYKLYTNSDATSGVSLAAGGGSWATISDRRKKENFRAIDCEEILHKVAALPLTTWNYKSQPATQRHIGPMAQDFYAAFQLDGIGSDTTINTVDMDGVNMAAIQALEKITKALQQENDDLRKRLAQLEQAVLTRTAPSNSGTASAIRKK